MMNILPDLAQAKDFIDKGTSGTNQFIGTTASTLLTAFSTGARNASIDTTGQSASDIRYIVSQLNLKGYKAEIGQSSKILVRW